MRDALITCARANIRTSGFTNAEARAGSLEDLPVADESIDWVISNCAINLASDKPRVFAEIARVLKPGGQVRITDIVAEGVPGWLRHDDARHGSRIAGAASEQDYLAGLRSAGLEHISLGGRYVFDREQVAGLMGGAKISSAETVRLVDAVVGRMWSVHFSAGKPTFTNTGTR
jgi:SAM-dependent methyltransferase